MTLYKIFSYNVEIHYKSYFLSKAMLFAIVTNFLNIVLPFIVAYRSRGFWLNSHYFYEKPTVRPTFDYLLIAETKDPSVPIICGETSYIGNKHLEFDDLCKEIQVQEYYNNEKAKSDILNYKIFLNIPLKQSITSLILIVGLDFYLMTVCPLQMQSLAVISRDFPISSNGLKYHGHLEFLQTTHLPCLRHHIDTTYNISLFDYLIESDDNLIDNMLHRYFTREVTSHVKPVFVRNQIGLTGSLDIDFYLKIPEMKILYTPSLLQELKWAWPQYLSLVVIFYWILRKIKLFVFNNRLLMAWEVIPWKKI